MKLTAGQKRSRLAAPLGTEAEAQHDHSEGQQQKNIYRALLFKYANHR